MRASLWQEETTTQTMFHLIINQQPRGSKNEPKCLAENVDILLQQNSGESIIQMDFQENKPMKCVKCQVPENLRVSGCPLDAGVKMRDNERKCK